MCPQLTWPLHVEEFSISFLHKVTCFLKRRSGLAQPANPALLFLPVRRGGLGLPSQATLYKKQQVSHYTHLLSSRDSSVREVAQHQLLIESGTQCQSFKPVELAQSVLESHSDLRQKALVKHTQAVVSTEEEESLVSHLLDQPQQQRMMSVFEGSMAALWARCVGKFLPEPLRFVLNATLETLPTNFNLYIWGKHSSATCPLCQQGSQSLLHILNDCPRAMSLRRYAA